MSIEGNAMQHDIKNTPLSIESSTVSRDKLNAIAVIQDGPKRTEIYFKSEQPLFLSLQAQAAIILLPAMQSGVPCVDLEGELEPLFKQNQITVQDIYASWYEEFTRVSFSSKSTEFATLSTTDTSIPVVKKRNGMFFSGGMDSFYSYLKHKDSVTDLIFVHGYDIALSDTTLREKTSAQLRMVAKENGVNLIEIETNLRDFLDTYVDWGKLGHGAALMTIGHLLADELDTIYVPSSYNYANLFPWGTHPLLDPYWSSSDLAFIHDGCEAKRVDKAKLIASSDSALESLRVCWKNPDSAYNCCKCEKCIRTMINLEIYDALERSSAFPDELTIEKVKNMPVNSHSAKEFVIENIKALQRLPQKSNLLDALTFALNKKPPSPPIHHRIRRRLRTLLGRD
jgi:hypothetical protein